MNDTELIAIELLKASPITHPVLRDYASHIIRDQTFADSLPRDVIKQIVAGDYDYFGEHANGDHEAACEMQLRDDAAWPLYQDLVKYRLANRVNSAELAERILLHVRDRIDAASERHWTCRHPKRE